MRFGLLGPVTVQLDTASAPTRIEQRMPEILLAALLLNAGRVVPSAKLTTALWGYDPPPSAASSLYNHVARLRRLLGTEGGGRIRTASAGYVIDVESDELDTTEFAALCADGTRSREAGAWAAASDGFTAALALWRGEPAEDVSGLDEWQARVEELRETRLQALDARIDADLRLGRHRQTTAELQALTLEYPLHESFHEHLMLALYRGGRQTDALNAYQKLRQSLSHELGIDPSPSVQRLHEAILNADPQLDLRGGAQQARIAGSPAVADVPAVAAAPAVIVASVSGVDGVSQSPKTPDEADRADGADGADGADRADRAVRRATVNGIPVLLCPASPGTRQHAGITFRVGMADEPLARAGITHLIEHLALHRLGVSDVHHNGATSATVTHFLMQGTADEAVAFIHSVCESLHDLPFERLETEKSILRTEANHHGPGWAGRLAASRYGARGHGIPGFGELGLPALTPEALRTWAAAYFTRDNAVLWFSGDEVPAGLDPRLPAGRRRPPPAASSALPALPAYVPGGPQGLIGVSALVRRGPAAKLFTELLERELFRHLRHEGGLSYAVRAEYTARDAEYAEIHATADALPATQDKLVSTFLGILAGLRDGEIDPAALDVLRERVLEARQAPDAAARALPGLAADLLLGRQHSSEAVVLERIRALTVEDVHAVAAEAADSALLVLPGHDLEADGAGYALVPQGSAVTAIGFPYRAIGDPGTQLVVGASAVSLHRHGSLATVTYAECMAMQAWPDGARQLWGHDGVRVPIEPSLFEAPAGFLAALDAAIPADRVVWQPARDPGEIPGRPPGTGSRPKRGEREPAYPRDGRVVRTLVHLAFWLFVVITVTLTLVAIIVSSDTDPDDGITVGVIIAVWIFDLVVGVLPLFLLARRRHRYEKAVRP